MKHESLDDYSGDPDLINKFREMVAVNAYYRAEKRVLNLVMKWMTGMKPSGK